MTAAPTQAEVVAALGQVPDPCASAAGLDLSIMDIGLVYDVTVAADGIDITITFTELGCQFTHRVVTDVIDAVRALDWTGELRVRPCWSPPWSPDRLSARAAEALASTRRAYPAQAGPVLLPVPALPRTESL
ncbi:MAG: iron-sulfur cluster assembly protein [Kibdelosporangium sp.]